MRLLSHAWSLLAPAAGSTVLLIDDDPFEASARKSMLERRFRHVRCVSSAAEALIRMKEPGLARHLALIVLALRRPGFAGPALVKELARLASGVPILVIGRAGESSLDYAAPNVRFLACDASTKDMLFDARALAGRRFAGSIL